ncbi:MAG: PqqD family protein [Acidobacteria bacterium]|nr:PqqD family protein [Acidobacteriota bacterium]
MNQSIPKARRQGLISHEVGDELLVYDSENHEAKCLNRTAALVWQNCDGQKSISDLAHQVTENLSIPFSEDIVHCALDQLREFHLLEPSSILQHEKARVSRRELIRKLGQGGAVAIPLVTSMFAPTAVEAYD